MPPTGVPASNREKDACIIAFKFAQRCSIAAVWVLRLDRCGNEVLVCRSRRWRRSRYLSRCRACLRGQMRLRLSRLACSVLVAGVLICGKHRSGKDITRHLPPPAHIRTEPALIPRAFDSLSQILQAEGKPVGLSTLTYVPYRGKTRGSRHRLVPVQHSTLVICPRRL
jgi:hypothetical protein